MKGYLLLLIKFWKSFEVAGAFSRMSWRGAIDLTRGANTMLVP